VSTGSEPRAPRVAATRAAWLLPAALDGALLGVFLFVAAAVVALVEWPGSPVRSALDTPLLRRCLVGLAMGATAVVLILSPWGQRSGAHFNPATTLTFLRLGRVPPAVAVGYVFAQCLGGALGLGVAAAVAWSLVSSPEVDFVATRPGAAGVGVAFAAETAMAFVLLSLVLRVSQSRRWHRWTPAGVGACVWLFIAFEAPLSGMSMNPARTFASAIVARDFTAFWVYATAPLLGMLLAAEWFVRTRGVRAVHCAKLHHDNPHGCPFRCGWSGTRNSASAVASNRGTLRGADPEPPPCPWNTTTSS
jgi:aquaporin Z